MHLLGRCEPGLAHAGVGGYSHQAHSAVPTGLPLASVQVSDN